MGIFDKWWKKGTDKAPEKPVLTVVASEPKDSKENLDSRLKQNEKDVLAVTNKVIICNGKSIPIKWPKVVLWTENNGLKCKPGSYSPQDSRKPTMFVAHWDVCLSSASMARVLSERGLSVHFAIDNDGTIYQLLDTKEIAWHAAGVNKASVGVEISNGVMLKYADHYKKIGLPERPTITGDKVHGVVLDPYLGFYPEQMEAFKALTRALHLGLGIPLKTPNLNGQYLKGVSQEVAKNTFRGVVGHFHVTTNKTDPGYLPLEKIVGELANEKE